MAAAQLWLEASRARVALNETSAAVAAAQQAVRSAPFDYSTREHLARVHMEAGQFAAAHKQYRWCLTRKPGDQRLLRQIAAAKQAELASGESVEQAALPAARR